MRVRQTLLVASLVALTVPTFSVQADEITYRWVDAEGNLQLSDTLPPRAAEQGYKVLNPSTGQVIREISPRKTEQQRAREAAERRAAERQRQVARNQAERDRTLLSLYGSEKDIKRVRDERLDRINSRIRQTERSIQRMEATIAAGHGDEAYKSDLKQLRQSLKETRAERRTLAERYHSDLKRFRQLQQGN